MLIIDGLIELFLEKQETEFFHKLNCPLKIFFDRRNLLFWN